jgi:hypothetical protein
LVQILRNDSEPDQNKRIALYKADPEALRSLLKLYELQGFGTASNRKILVDIL